MGKLAEIALQYFRTTPPEQLRQDWEDLKKYNEHGPDMMAVLNNYGRGCAFDFDYSTPIEDEYSLIIPFEEFPHEYTDTELWLAA